MLDGYHICFAGGFLDSSFLKKEEFVHSKDNKEIERIWILPQMPSQELITHNIPHEISYLFSDKTGEMRVVKRFKSEGDKFSITVKSRGDLIRDEWEDDNLPQWAYNILVKQAICKIVKTRYFVNYNNYKLEVDKYSHREVYNPYFIMNMDIKDKIRLECEFSSEEEANKFVLPPWAEGAIEVTSKPEFKNSVIALNGWPDEPLEKEIDMQVDIGQVWEDKDRRRVGRKFKVDRIVNGKAICQVIQAGLSEGKSPVRIRLDRFIPKYYSLTAGKPAPVQVVTPSVQNEPTFLEEIEKLTSFKWNSPVKNYVNANIGNVSVLLHKIDDRCFDLKISINDILVFSKVVNNTLEDVVFVELAYQIASILDNIDNIYFSLGLRSKK